MVWRGVGPGFLVCPRLIGRGLVGGLVGPGLFGGAGRVGPVCGLFVMISQPFCRFCRSLAYIWLLAYINVCLYAYIPMRLYKATLNKGQKTPKCYYAFRKKNFEEKKCLFLTEA